METSTIYTTILSNTAMYHEPSVYKGLRREYLRRTLYDMTDSDLNRSDINYYIELYNKIAKLTPVKKAPKQEVNLERFL